MKKLATNERGFIFIVAIGLNPLDLLTIKKLYIDLPASVKKNSFYFIYCQIKRRHLSN